jgi:hypothetical protein
MVLAEVGRVNQPQIATRPRHCDWAGTTVSASGGAPYLACSWDTGYLGMLLVTYKSRFLSDLQHPNAVCRIW